MRMNDSLQEKAVEATKWSLATQVVSKLISPVTQLVLAHILAPDAFGIIAIITMIVSFADMFSDAGFQKYLIQHDYRSARDLELSADVAFWTNLFVSVAIWASVCFFKDNLASLLGNSSIGFGIAVACSSLPLTALISVQTALYQRRFNFRILFSSKVGSSLLIMLVSIPLAVLGFDYWSLIIGTIVSNIFLAIWLTLKSDWVPRPRYDFGELRAMFTFSAWTLIEAFSIWLTTWAGALILGSLMSSYYLGLFNTSVSLVNAVTNVIAGAINPVAFSALSRLQFDKKRFNSTFYTMQSYLGFAVIPIACALFVFSDLLVGVFLGPSWTEASTFFGLYSLSSAFVVVFGHIASDAYRAIGKPQFSLAAQLGFLAFYVPSLYAGSVLGFAALSHCSFGPNCRISSLALSDMQAVYGAFATQNDEKHEMDLCLFVCCLLFRFLRHKIFWFWLSRSTDRCFFCCGFVSRFDSYEKKRADRFL